MAFYRPEDWQRLLSIADDREKLHNTWDEWHQEYQKTRKFLASEGFEVNEVVVDIDKLIGFCFQNGIRNDGKARSQFVSNTDSSN